MIPHVVERADRLRKRMLIHTLMGQAGLCTGTTLAVATMGIPPMTAMWVSLGGCAVATAVQIHRAAT